MIYRFVPTPRDDEYEYWRGFARAWAASAVIVNVEHDMQYTPALAAELLHCPHPLCSHAYQMHIPRDYYAHSHNRDGMDGFWIGHGKEWAVYSAIGFCKITPEARIGPLERDTWRGVEWRVNAATQGLWHIHWGPDGEGIEHYHYREAV